MNGATDNNRLQRHFGPGASITPVTSADRMGRRIHGVDLTTPLTPEQAKLLVSLLDEHRIICFPDQDRAGFDVNDLERLANHFGAPLPHPKNYANYASRTKDSVLELMPAERRTSTRVDEAFPGSIECIAGADSPAVYIVTNIPGSGPEATPEIAGGQHWHTDIEFEPIPLSTSMFYVQTAPMTRGTGMKSLHSPVWASRGKRIAPVEVDGMSDDESRAYLDRLENHCLQPEFRYDHAHHPGDVTIWSNFATLHTAPPYMRTIDDPADARLLYRISCKGEPSFELPRSDDDAWIDAHITPPYRTA